MKSKNSSQVAFNMFESQFTLTHFGIYLFKSPSVFTATLDRDLLIVLNIKKPSSCAVLLHNPLDPERVIKEGLENLKEKIFYELKAVPVLAEAKIFGTSRGDSPAYQLAIRWLTQHGIRIVAQDVGRNVKRNVLVNCDTGQVGVTYAESFIPHAHIFVTGTSAKDRLKGRTSKTRSILILSGSPVKQRLIKQSTEQDGTWTGEVPENLGKFFRQNRLDDFPWTSVLISSETSKVTGFSVWFHSFRSRHPEVPIIWAGKPLPKESATLIPIPKISPEKVGVFKKMLRAALEIINATSAGKVLSFKKRA